MIITNGRKYTHNKNASTSISPPGGPPPGKHNKVDITGFILLTLEVECGRAWRLTSFRVRR